MRKASRDLFIPKVVDDGPSGSCPAPERASPIKAMGRAMQSLRDENIRLSEIVANGTGAGDVAPEILKLVLDVTADHDSRQSWALLYLALQGHPITLGETIAKLDFTRRQWWRQAMFEFSTGQWRGNHQGEAAILAIYPELSNLLQKQPMLRERKAVAGNGQACFGDRRS